MATKEDKSTDRFMSALFGALEAVPQILEEKKKANALLIEDNELKKKILAGRAALLQDLPPAALAEEADEVAPDTKAKAGKAKPAAEEEEEEEPGLGEEEEEAPAVTKKDIKQYFRDEVAKGGEHATRVKAAFANVRRTFCGEHTEGENKGKPKDLDSLPAGKEAEFLTEWKRKIVALGK